MAQSLPHIRLRERFNISKYAIQHPWLTLGFWIAVMVAGIFAFGSLKYALFPDITFPVVVVNATASLSSSLDTEAKLTQPLEQTLQPLKQEGLESIRSSTYAGRSLITLSFEVGTNLEKSTTRVTTALKQLTLPKGSSYTVTPINLNESSVISYAIESPKYSLAELTKLTNQQLVPAIATIPGVLRVNLFGTVPDTKVSAPSQPATPSQSATPEPHASFVRFNNHDALAVEVIKRSDISTLDVVHQVEKTVQALQPKLSDVQITLAKTQAAYIREASQATVDALLLAIALSVIVIFPFLWDWKATLISALAIPTSLLGTFIVMAIWGFNLETITLLALALVIGIIVDDAIVDVENIARHLETGESPRQAAVLATNEIGLTVTAATFAIVAVFLPVGLMGGVLGQFFRPFGITVSAAVIISLLVARTLSPLLAVHWLRAKPNHDAGHHWTRFIEGYRTLLKWSLHHRGVVLGIAVLSFAAGVALIPFVPKGFIPKLDRGEFIINYTVAFDQTSNANVQDAGLAATAPDQRPEPVNPLTKSLDAAKRLEAAIFKSPQVESVFTTIGTRESEPNKGTLYIKLKRDRSITTATVQDQLRQQLPALSNVTTSVEDIPFVETAGEQPLQVALLGDNPLILTETAKTIKRRVETMAGFRNVTITGEANTNDHIVAIDRLDSRTVTYISADLAQGLALGTATDQVVAIANQVKPANVAIHLDSDSARAGEIFDSFGTTLSLSVLCVLLVLMVLFRSWKDPLVIVFSLPLSIIGALLSSLFTGSDFGIISVIGLIFLLGLTNKNAILLVDQTNQLRRIGLSCTDAILQAGPLRLRPILMTTTATILGMLPIALGVGAGAELRAPMAIAIIGGLITSTLLSLLVVPVVYALLAKRLFPTLKYKKF